MTIDWWGIGLQALNVLILIWLLSRVLWKPVSQAIEQRRATAQATLDAADDARTEADRRLASLNAAHANIAAERSALLKESSLKAEAQGRETLAQARQQAEALLSSAHDAITRESDLTRQQDTQHALSLAVAIATRLLAPLDNAAVHAAFRERLHQKITTLTRHERDALTGALQHAPAAKQPPAHSARGAEAAMTREIAGTAPSGNVLSIITAAQLSATQQAELKDLLTRELDPLPGLRFEVEPALLGGVELRSAHFALNNSWQSDLSVLAKAFEAMPTPPSASSPRETQHVS